MGSLALLSPAGVLAVCSWTSGLPMGRLLVDASRPGTGLQARAFGALVVIPFASLASAHLLSELIAPKWTHQKLD